MEKHIQIWNKTSAFLKDIVDYCTMSIDSLLNEKEENELAIKNKKSHLKELEYEDRIWEFEGMNRLLGKSSGFNEGISDFKILREEPFFYRVKTNLDEIYITKYKSEIEKKIVLFTAPIATLRYVEIDNQETIGNKKYIIEEKDKFLVKGRNLNEIDHEDKEGSFIYDGSICSQKRREQKDIPVSKQQLQVQEIRSTSEEPKKYVLGEIIDKMRKEQDEVMRAPVDGITLIKGSAGSGKTDIAFHRIVYLIEEFPNNENPGRVFREENIAVFCFNRSLKKYLLNLTKDLGIENIKIFSFDKWLTDLVKKFSNVSSINYLEDEQVRINRSRKEMFDKIQEFLEQKMKKIHIAIQDNEDLSGVVQPKHSAINSLNDIRILRNNTHDNLTCTEIGRDGKEKQLPDTDEIKRQKETINKALEYIVRQHLCKQWSWRDDNKIVFDGAKLLSEFYDYIGDRERAQRFDTTINISDAHILAHIINILSRGLKIFPRFDHIVVDEVQDFAPIEILLLKGIHNNSMTICGDITQGIISRGVKQWEDLGFFPDYIYELKLSHRSTLENILFANEVLLPNDQNIITGRVAKRGKKPYILNCLSFENTLKLLADNITEIRNRQPNSSIVVVFPKNNGVENIYKKLRQSNIDAYIAGGETWVFSNKTHLTSYHQVKGLEFDYVFILGLNEFERGPWVNKENVLYTCITRAQKRCFIFYENVFPGLIKNVDKDLYEHFVSKVDKTQSNINSNLSISQEAIKESDKNIDQNSLTNDYTLDDIIW